MRVSKAQQGNSDSVDLAAKKEKTHAEVAHTKREKSTKNQLMTNFFTNIESRANQGSSPIFVGKVETIFTENYESCFQKTDNSESWRS